MRTRKGMKGQGMTEYIIIVALIAVAAIVAFQFFGQQVRGSLAGTAGALSGKAVNVVVDTTGTDGADVEAADGKGLDNFDSVKN